MKDFDIIPFHDTLGETLRIRNCDEAGIFEVRISDGKFKENCFYHRQQGELGKIRANAYKADQWKRVFMYLDHRCPTWPEMVELANMFFMPGEVAIQFHPCEREYVNENPTALHLWEPKDTEQLENLAEASKVVRYTTEKLRTLQQNNGVLKGVENGKSFIAIFCGYEWLSWNEVCAIKREHFGPETTAFQLNISKEFDLHPSKILTLWHADEFGIKLPPKEIV